MSKANNQNANALIGLLDKYNDQVNSLNKSNNELITSILAQERASSDELQARLMSLVGIQHWSSQQIKNMQHGVQTKSQEESLPDLEKSQYDDVLETDNMDVDDYIPEPLPFEERNPFKSLAGIEEYSVDPRDLIEAEEKVSGADLDELIG